MSYNIDSWKQISGSPLRISEKNARKLERKFDDECPERWFVEDLKFGEDGYANVKGSLIYGEGGSNFYNDHMADVAAALEGEADFVIIWGGGDSISGLRIYGGKSTEMDVAFSLVEKKPR
jgi:hypothetical protein